MANKIKLTLFVIIVEYIYATFTSDSSGINNHYRLFLKLNLGINFFKKLKMSF